MRNLDDITYMKKTFQLAVKGLGWTNPNPMVGSVVVKNGKIIATGFHRKAGAPHAEIEALSTSRKDIQGSTLYVNLEPCVHHGKTPPCVDAIIRTGIKRVACAVVDPNPNVSGQGIAKLKKDGIEVTVGILEDKAKILNEQFFTFHQKGRPFVAIHFGSSLDGKIATYSGDSKWINNEKARECNRKLRSRFQAILVGVTTVLVDNPHLGVRTKGLKDPLRIILDPKLQTPPQAQVLRDDNVLLVTTDGASPRNLKVFQKRGIPIIKLKGKNIAIRRLLATLKEREILSIFVEGGGKTLGHFADEKLIDKVYAFYGHCVIGGETAISAIQGQGAKTLKQAIWLKDIEITRFADDFLVTGYAI